MVFMLDFFFACSSTVDVSVAIIYVKLWFDSAVFLLIENCNLVY